MYLVKVRYCQQYWSCDVAYQLNMNYIVYYSSTVKVLSFGSIFIPIQEEYDLPITVTTPQILYDLIYLITLYEIKLLLVSNIYN